jgi:hypothetical protein
MNFLHGSREKVPTNPRPSLSETKVSAKTIPELIAVSLVAVRFMSQFCSGLMASADGNSCKSEHPRLWKTLEAPARPQLALGDRASETLKD